MVKLQQPLGVRESAFESATWVAGKKKTSVLMSAVFTSPFLTSGAVFQ